MKEIKLNSKAHTFVPRQQHVPVEEVTLNADVDTKAVEVTNSVYIITPKHAHKHALKQFIRMLENAGFQTQDIEVHQFGSDDVKIQAVLMASAVDGDEMDKLMTKIADQDFVSQAFWSPSTTD
jgi:putative Mg2+ transporter-C (MgtC) family protein